VPTELQPKIEQMNGFVEQKLIFEKMIVQQSLILALREYADLREIARSTNDSY
jgi:hypothetical protein